MLQLLGAFRGSRTYTRLLGHTILLDSTVDAFPFVLLTFPAMSLLIFLGVALATALLALNTFDQVKASLKPIPVRAKNRR